jgi:hypothetical protein
MSQAPFSIPNADSIVGGSHVLKKQVSLNILLRGRPLRSKGTEKFDKTMNCHLSEKKYRLPSALPPILSAT